MKESVSHQAPKVMYVLIYPVEFMLSTAIVKSCSSLCSTRRTL
jgi:hypothetical protein